LATIPHTTTHSKTQKPNNVNVKKYYFVKVSREKENNSKLQQTGTKIFVWQAVAIKQKALDKTDQVWGSYGRELRRIISLGLEADDRQQQTPIFTNKKTKERGDVITNYEIMRSKLNEFRGSSSSSYPVFHINTVKRIVTDVLDSVGIHDKRTVKKYYLRILKLSKLVQTSRFDITGFMEHDFIKC